MAAENKASFATRCRNRLESGAREEGRVFPAGSPSGYSPVQTTSNGSVPLEGIPTLSSSEQRPILVHRNGPVQQNSTRSQIEKSVHELKNYEPQWESGSADDPLDNNSADLQPIMVIDQIGDAVLQLMDRDGSSVSKYRVSSEQLKKVSGYFDAMLTPGKFSESTQFYSQIEALKSKFDGDCGKAPAAKLPILSFPEVMELTLSKSTTQALTALLLLSHGQTDMKEKQSVNSMAHLAVIAEQVLATDITRQYVLTYLRKLKAKSPRWSPVVQDKEKWRQLVYLGYVYDDIEVFAWFSALLIDHGPDIVVEHNPEKHSKKENSRARTRTESEIIPPWFNLPNDMEGNHPTPPILTCTSTNSNPRRAVLSPPLHSPYSGLHPAISAPTLPFQPPRDSQLQTRLRHLAALRLLPARRSPPLPRPQEPPVLQSPPHHYPRCP